MKQTLRVRHRLRQVLGKANQRKWLPLHTPPQSARRYSHRRESYTWVAIHPSSSIGGCFDKKLAALPQDTQDRTSTNRASRHKHTGNVTRRVGATRQLESPTNATGCRYLVPKHWGVKMIPFDPLHKDNSCKIWIGAKFFLRSGLQPLIGRFACL